MASKRKKSNQKKTKSNAFTASVYFRPLIVLLVGVVLAIGAIGYAHVKKDPFAGAQTTADNFVAAFSTCDISAISKDYIVFQTNPDKVKEFQAQCKPGETSFTFNRQPTKGSDETKDGIESKNVAYVYDYKIAGNKSGQVMIYLIWSSDTKTWQVFSINAVTL